MIAEERAALRLWGLEGLGHGQTGNLTFQTWSAGLSTTQRIFPRASLRYLTPCGVLEQRVGKNLGM